jgi:hypothetical protein
VKSQQEIGKGFLLIPDRAQLAPIIVRQIDLLDGRHQTCNERVLDRVKRHHAGIWQSHTYLFALLHCLYSSTESKLVRFQPSPQKANQPPIITCFVSLNIDWLLTILPDDSNSEHLLLQSWKPVTTIASTFSSCHWWGASRPKRSNRSKSTNDT